MFFPGESVASSRTSSPLNGIGCSRKASIVLIGMRGVGKTTLATIIAKALGWGIIDTDTLFEEEQQTTIAAFIASNGWEAFRRMESRILANVLRVHLTGKIIACGGGITDLEANRLILHRFREHGLVIHVLREKETVLAYLKESTHFPPYIHETAVETWERREICFRECCSFEFVSMTVPIPPAPPSSTETVTPDQTLALKPVEQDFFRLLRFIHGVDTNQVALGSRGHRTYFLALTFDDVRKAIPILDDICIGIDLWEIRVDFLISLDLTFLAFQIATLRRYSTLPILFTIRTVSQGGKYPDINSNDAEAVSRLSSLLHHALRLGVEYIDLEVVYPQSILRETIAQKGHTTVIGSYHDWKGNMPWMGYATRQMYDTIVRMGADIVEIVNFAKSFEDNMSLRQFFATVENEPHPLLAINMGPEGKISRALNTVLCPVSHPLLPKPSAPGQISFHECQSILYLTGLLPSRKYYVIGSPVKNSISPILHNTAFLTLGLPHTYEVREAPTIEQVKDLIHSTSFGGASVTIPHKQNIIPLLQHLSRHAQIIGAVNTIMPISGPGGGFSGDNTDWRAIKTCLLRSLTPAHVVTSSTTALVLGAGGTARATVYALHQIGVINIFIFNRTKSKADKVAEDFNKLDSLLNIQVISEFSVPLPIYPPPTMVISTIPAIAVATDSVKGPIDLGLRGVHLSPIGGVAMELAYEHRTTNLLVLAEEKRQQGYRWTVVEGIEVLLEQGYEQCRIWTGRRAPKKQVREKVLDAYEKVFFGNNFC
ncbi:type I 3-dehydroquinase-domain-containing protein [Collybia nuda]|uniref:Type I 3-dehydroquinase-domain-containing protein n=1 Tax=Collybia nuda TaxID=64659 RepID=A0A9P5Y3Y9_9AGAR|nr:type I 3-dehydroquinase-domain-containing protein [Collybia nuda]